MPYVFIVPGRRNSMNELPQDCKNWATCKAPLCPLDDKNDKVIWYPEDDICRRRGMPKWVSTQKKIARIVKDKTGYFTLADIQKIQRVSRACVGTNPDGRYKPHTA